jgi:hypothetical protein
MTVDVANKAFTVNVVMVSVIMPSGGARSFGQLAIWSTRTKWFSMIVKESIISKLGIFK